MGINSPQTDKPIPANQAGDKSVSKPVEAQPPLDGSLFLKANDTAARNYGKGGPLGDLPITDA
jgi:hypothetical protein